MKKIDVCLSPEMVHLHKTEGKVVVVIDILRATSCMTTALAHGINSITPVATLDECKALGAKGYLTAAERDGKKVEGFDLGNSPFSYQDPALKGRDIVVTTTNGTQAIVKSAGAAEILIGSFLNFSAVVTYLRNQELDVLMHCAGWKGKMNLEDTLFAGGVVDALKGEFSHDEDSVVTALNLFYSAQIDMLGFLSNSSHVRRLQGLGITKDIEFCLTKDVYTVLPVIRYGRLVSMEEISNG
ncbi:MAG: 2-phosphosulfolactate phosphatase [Cytophagales bacterium]|nr:2-phosphosulfolactate phosphatase [Cytophaga sp.]